MRRRAAASSAPPAAGEQRLAAPLMLCLVSGSLLLLATYAGDDALAAAASIAGVARAPRATHSPLPVYAPIASPSASPSPPSASPSAGETPSPSAAETATPTAPASPSEPPSPTQSATPSRISAGDVAAAAALGPFDLAVWRAPPPARSAGGAEAARASLRANATACNTSFYDGVAVLPPLSECSAAELMAAVAAASRTGEGATPMMGAPLVVPGCRMEWYSGERVCDLLQAIGGLDLMGDSLVRHMVQTVRVLAIGNLDTGLNKHLNDLAWVCECNGAYDDGHARRFGPDYASPHNALCRSYSLSMQSLDAIRGIWPHYCPAWGATDFLPSWGDFFVDYPPSARGAYHVRSGGLHSQTGLDAAAADFFFDKARLPLGARKYIFATLHAPGLNKPTKYLENFGTEATVAYNHLIRERAAAAGAAVLDAYAVTVNTPSIDGQHYFMGANIDLAQVLLNLVAAIHREEPPSQTATATATATGTATAAPTESSTGSEAPRRRRSTKWHERH